MRRHKLTPDEEQEVTRRLRIRWENTTKNLMAEFRCSRSVIDRISKESKMLVNRESKQKTTIADILLRAQSRP